MQPKSYKKTGQAGFAWVPVLILIAAVALMAALAVVATALMAILEAIKLLFFWFFAHWKELVAVFICAAQLAGFALTVDTRHRALARFIIPTALGAVPVALGAVQLWFHFDAAVDLVVPYWRWISGVLAISWIVALSSDWESMTADLAERHEQPWYSAALTFAMVASALLLALAAVALALASWGTYWAVVALLALIEGNFVSISLTVATLIGIVVLVAFLALIYSRPERQDTSRSRKHTTASRRPARR